MGCWNGTCAISQLPILSGDKVKLIILRTKENLVGNLAGGGMCYSSGVTVPMSLPMEVTYNDYGSGEKVIENYNTKHLLNYFKEELKDGKIFYKVGKHDKVKPLSSVENLLYNIERGYVFTNGILQSSERYYLPECPISFVMILNSVWDSMINAVVSLSSNFFSFEREDDPFYGTRENSYEMIEDYFKYLKKSFSSNDPCSRIILDRWSILDGNWKRNFLSGLRQYDRVDTISFLKYHMYLEDLLEKEDTVNLEEFKKDLFEFVTISTVMEVLRKTWIPQAGAGSQDQDFEIYTALADTMKKHCEDKLKEWEEY